MPIMIYINIIRRLWERYLEFTTVCNKKICCVYVLKHRLCSERKLSMYVFTYNNCSKQQSQKPLGGGGDVNSWRLSFCDVSLFFFFTVLLFWTVVLLNRVTEFSRLFIYLWDSCLGLGYLKKDGINHNKIFCAGFWCEWWCQASCCHWAGFPSVQVCADILCGFYAKRTKFK